VSFVSFPPRPPSRLTLGIAAIAAAALGVFWPALAGGWLWDDGLEVADNPFLRGLSGLGAIWRGASGQDYFPLKDTLLWAQWHLWADHTTGYHLINVGCHVLCALLLWRVLYKLGVGRSAGNGAATLFPAWCGALLFTIHPLAVESVAWIAEFKNLASLALLLLAADRYLDFSEGTHHRRSYWWSLAWFGGAMLAKSSVVMFPVMQLLHARWRKGGISRSDLRNAVPFFVVSVVLGLTTVWLQHHRAMADAPFPGEGWWSRVAAAGLAAPTYLYRCLFPFELMPIYPRWNVASPSLLQFLPWAALAAAAAWAQRQKSPIGRAAAFGGACFFVNLIPVLGFVPMAFQRLSWTADHWAYVSLACYCGLVAAAVGAAWNPVRQWLMAAVLLVMVPLGCESRALAGHYQNAEALWAYELAQNPGAWSAEYSLGTLLLQRGQIPAGTGHLRRAVGLQPDFVPARLNLANALIVQGEFLEGLVQYRQALRLQPGSPEIHYNLGNAFWRMRRKGEAIAEYREALRLRPDYPEAAANLQGALRSSR
jgi:tetratricopeptide (TPR) repeat protein